MSVGARRRPARLAPRQCAHCGEWFTPTNGRQRYCTPAHQREQARQRQREARQAAVSSWQARVRELGRQVARARSEASR